MPSVRYYNQTAPFWDFVANLEEQGSSHPFFGNRGDAENGNTEQQNPWTRGWAGFPFGPVPHRGHHGHHHGPPPPPTAGQEGEAPPPEYQNEKEGEAGPSEPREEKPQPGPSRCGPEARRGGGCGMRGRGRGAWGGRGRWGGPGGPGGFPMGGLGALANMFQEGAQGEKSEEFAPDVDVFDTAEAFVIHVSLPGAKKEDVGVNYDSEKSELSIAGVVYRPGDEELLKTLALDERKVGVFDRKVRLGSRANPAQVDVDAITARIEDGILRVEVPKLDSGYVEVKKIDIE